MVTAILLRLLPYVHSVIPLIGRVRSHEALPASSGEQLHALDLEDLLEITATYVKEIRDGDHVELPMSIVVALESVERQVILVKDRLETLHKELEAQMRWSAWFWSFLVTPKDTDRLVTELATNSSILRHRLDLLFGVVRAVPNPHNLSLKGTLL